MPRTGRQRSESGIYHVTLRGNNKIPIFLDDQDRSIFLNAVHKVNSLGSFYLFAYCLMDNHVHLLVKEAAEELSSCMKKVGVRYVSYFNKKYNRSGHLFQDRYHSEPVDSDEYLLVLLSYIHNNPVRAGMVSEPQNYQWSSCSLYYSQDKFATDLVDKNALLTLLDEGQEKALQKMQQFTVDDLKDPKAWKREEKNANPQTKAIEHILAKENLQLETLRLCKDKSIRDRVLREIKETVGISSRQLSELLGLSKDIIFRA